MFRSLFQDHLQGSSFALSAPTTLQLHAVLIFGRMPSIFMCIPVYACVLSGRALHDQTAHRQQVHRIHIQIEGIRPHTNTDK
jgi:hypothetical protein